MHLDKYLEQQLDDLFGGYWTIVPQKRCVINERESSSCSNRMPSCPLSLTETAEGFTVAVELAGIKKSDITLSTEKNVLTIAAEKRGVEPKDGKALINERRLGKLERSIKLPPNCDCDNVKASFEDGVLQIQFPKKAESIAQKIPIN